MQTQVLEFDQFAWRILCEKAADVAAAEAGLSYALQVDRLSVHIDLMMLDLPEDFHEIAIAVARDVGYVCEDERARARVAYKKLGQCEHGITVGFCPEGCFHF